MDCREIKNRLFDYCEQYSHAPLSTELSQHLLKCKDCEIYYESLLKGFMQIEQEKESELNPYLVNKVLLKISQQTKEPKGKLVLRNSFYFTSILLAGILTGTLINFSTLTVNDASTKQIVSEEQSTESNTVSDNSTLTLNDW